MKECFDCGWGDTCPILKCKGKPACNSWIPIGTLGDIRERGRGMKRVCKNCGWKDTCTILDYEIKLVCGSWIPIGTLDVFWGDEWEVET